MWYHASFMQPLLNLCHTADIAEKSGIHISKHIANKTVWDSLALANPDQPVSLTGDEAADAIVTSDQSHHIKQYVNQSAVLLDYGCGNGRIAAHLLPQVSLAGYIGLDSSHEMLKLFRERYDRADAEQATPLLLINADINHPPLIDNTIDVAVVAAVFRHNHKSVVKKAVYELARVVKPGGTVLVYCAFPRVFTIVGLGGQLYQIALNLLGRPFKNGPVRYYTKSEVKHLYRDFASVQVVPVGYTVIPQRLIFLPAPLQTLWQSFIANPLNLLLQKITPAPLQRYFATHYDIIAKR